MMILEVWINIFQNFKKCFNSFQSSFRALCLLKTWFDSLKETKNCNYLLEGYKSVHHNKHSSRWFIIQNLCQNFWLSPEGIERLCVEIKKKTLENLKNIILSLIYNWKHIAWKQVKQLSSKTLYNAKHCTNRGFQS